ncbi:histamine N-methyltransferase-like [Antedon mediterranea]|uniref:histamine N-methyltransferase-like n=1 Tax=Antedon mediterranea TaxID=105859 RepID=UPI003AF9B328
MSISSTESYASSFMEFRRMSDQNDKMKSWLKEKLDECIEEDSLKRKDECRILGVGSGVGEIDCFICENLQKKQKNICVRVLEPNAIEMNHFKANVCSNKCLDFVKFDWRQVDALDYFKETPDKRFHIIHLFHVLYYFKGNEMNVIQQCFNQLEVGGRLLIIQASASSRLECIRNAFAKELCSLKGKFNRISGEDLLFRINRFGYKYHSDSIRSSLDVSQCLADPKSESGSLLWDFITVLTSVLKHLLI